MPTGPALADELVAAVRTFVEKEVLPVASGLEHADAYPDDLVEGMKSMGLFGCTIPEEFGGLGLDVMTYARNDEELSAGWKSLRGIVKTHPIAATLNKQHDRHYQNQRNQPKRAAVE